jgi:hypothetical protein
MPEGASGYEELLLEIHSVKMKPDYEDQQQFLIKVWVFDAFKEGILTVFFNYKRHKEKHKSNEG